MKLYIYQSRNDGWKNMTVSSALLSNSPDTAEKRMRNSPHWIGCWTPSLYCCFDVTAVVIDVLCFAGLSSDISNAFTELKSSTGVRGVREATAVDNISRTCKNICGQYRNFMRTCSDRGLDDKSMQTNFTPKKIQVLYLFQFKMAFHCRHLKSIDNSSSSFSIVLRFCRKAFQCCGSFCHFWMF